MNSDYLFLKTLDDLKAKIESRDVYETLMAAGLLRKLLIDENPLINQVNKSRKLKILFTINDRTLPVITDGLTFWSIQDGFDPESSVPYLSKPIVVNKGEMLKRQIMFINGKTITVLDLIKFLSHVQGAVHAGKPKDEKEEILRHVEETLTIGGMPGGVRSIGAIGRVVLRGLKPLKQEILKT